MKKEEKYLRMTISVPRIWKEELQLFAEKDGRNISNFIRIAVVEKINRIKKKEQQNS